MLKALRARLQQKHRTMPYPDGPPPKMPDRFAGRPITGGRCPEDCRACREACPTAAIKPASGGPVLDMGLCLFCRSCEATCENGGVSFSTGHQLAAGSRDALVVRHGSPERGEALSATAARYFGRSLRLRQVSAGGCNACEADSNVLGTPAWDMGRFGIQFVASPRHADGLLVTGPVTTNMREALLRTWEAVPEPRVVIAVGACAIGGGPYRGHDEVCNGADTLIPVDLYVPGCPPHPLTILDGLLRFLGHPVPSAARLAGDRSPAGDAPSEPGNPAPTPSSS